MKQSTEAMSFEAGKAAIALQDKLDRLLAKAKPNKRQQVLIDFRDLYPKLEQHIALGKPLKEVLAAFNALTQCNVCVRKFNEMLASERNRRDKEGDPACCLACGKVLKSLNPERTSPKVQTTSGPETIELENAQ